MRPVHRFVCERKRGDDSSAMSPLKGEEGAGKSPKSLHSFRLVYSGGDAPEAQIFAQSDADAVCCTVPFSSLETVIDIVPLSGEVVVRFIESQLPQFSKMITAKFRQQPDAFLSDPTRPGMLQGTLTRADIETGREIFSTHSLKHDSVRAAD